MQQADAFSGIFLYGAFVYTVMQIINSDQDGAAPINVTDAVVVLSFLTNCIMSYVAFDNAETQLLFLMISTNVVFMLVLFGCNLGKRWTSTFVFIGVSLVPIVLILLFLTPETDCTSRMFALAIVVGYGSYFLTQTASRRYTEDKQMSYRVVVAVAFLLQTGGVLISLGKCSVGNWNKPLWLASMRFAACCCLAYAVSFERMSFASEE